MATSKKRLAGNETAAADCSNGHGNGATNTNGSGGKANGDANGTSTTFIMNGSAKSITSSSANMVLSDFFLRMLRTILIDAPLTILFAALVITICTRNIYDNYLLENLISMEWTEERKVAEITYYDRRCDPSDVSTRNVADLLIQSNYTKDDCVHHMMVHGASVYPDLLSADTATKLRQFVLRRNAELTDKDAISVIANNQRWSFGIGANEDPSVAKALQEIATHPQLVPALEGIAGHDPAVIEMTAITSAYGGENCHENWLQINDAQFRVDTKHFPTSQTPLTFTLLLTSLLYDESMYSHGSVLAH